MDAEAPVQPRALEGMRVVELGGGITADFAARLLGDFGADVLKVERPGPGDRMRRANRQLPEQDGTQPESPLFESLNWNKRSISLDSAAEENRHTLARLMTWTDVVLLSLSPGRLEQWGLSPEILHGWNPKLVITQISNFGQSGPCRDWKATDLVFQAMGGVMQISGTVGREPLKPGLRQSFYCAGLNAAYVSVAGYYHSLNTGHGPLIDLSILETVASELVMNEPYYAFMGVVQGRRPVSQDALAGDPLPTSDGYVTLQTNTFTPVSRLAEVFDDERLAAPKFATADGRMRHAAEFHNVLEEHLQSSTSRDLFVRVSENGLLAGFVQGSKDLLECPQLKSRDVFRQSGAGPLNSLKYPARLVDLSETPMSFRRSAPAAGQHTVEVTAMLGQDSMEVYRGPPPSLFRNGMRPLEGLRVVDLSTVFAVPYVGALLADFGAEVIKVESPGRLDQSRAGFGGLFDNDPDDAYWDRATTFQVLNRGKKSVAVDLNQFEGQELLRDLVKDADILLDNFTPRVMRKWGTTFDELKLVNPRLIMLSNTGYGSTGPWSAFKAQGTTLEASMGLSYHAGYLGERPSKTGQSYPDFLACWTGLLAIMSALVYRNRTGIGQFIDLGMYQLGAFVIPEALVDYQLTGRDLGSRGNADIDALFSGVFPCAAPDTWVAISISSTTELEELTALVPTLAGLPGDCSDAERVAAVSAWTRHQSADGVASSLQSSGIAAGPVLNARDLLENHQLQSRQFYEWIDYGPSIGPRPLIGRPFRWLDGGRSEVRIESPAPNYATSNDEVISSLPGMTADLLAELRSSGVVADSPRNPPPMGPADTAAALASGAFAELDPNYRAVLERVRPA